MEAYDIEFGFADDKLWLFQIRPFVESKSNWEELIAEPAEVAAEASPAKSFPWWILLVVVALGAGGFLFWKNRENNSTANV